MKSKMVSIRMKDETKQQLQKEADMQGRSLTNYILFLISKGRTSAMKKGLIVLVGMFLMGCGHQDSSSIPVWTQSEQDATLNGCITSSHASLPSASFSTVESYCQCMLDATMKMWSASEFNANAVADAKVLTDNGTKDRCKKSAGI